MKLAISNIAWPLEDTPAVADVMAEFGITGVEIAPTIRWPHPLEAGDEEIKAYRRTWNDRGIEIVAMQALLYGRPDLTLFESREQRRETLAYLRRIMRLGSLLGAGPLVFGSPKNRRVGQQPPAEIEAMAVSFFRAAGEAALEEGVVLCIEPNPVDYGCDFITTAEQGRALVETVGSAGFGLHLDAAGMTLSRDALIPTLERCADRLCHFHISEPFLGPIGEGAVDHDTLAATLRRLGYSHWTSVEMRHNPNRDTVAELRRVLAFQRRVYGNAKPAGN